MAGSAMTFTHEKPRDAAALVAGICRLVVAWTSDDTTGAVSGTTSGRIVGTLIKGVTDPGAAAPTDNYDITITDEEGVDVLAASTNSLANRSISTTQQVYFNLSGGAAPIAAYPVVADALTISVTNAGNSKTGQLILYYMPQ